MSSSRFPPIRILVLVVVMLWLLLGRAFAQENATISISRVDSTRFPQVQVDFFVTDGLGAPLVNLVAADFQIFEDGIKVPASAVAVDPNSDQPLSLVLAVDISTEAADLERIKAGLLALVDQLKPEDQVLLLSFFDEVRVEQPPTTDKVAVRTAIERLSVTGNFTTLNQAAVEALNRAMLLSHTRKAIVIVTDSVENSNTLSPEAISSRAGEVNLPIYLIAFSPKVQAPGVIDSFAQQLKAQSYILATATEAQLRLQTLSSLFNRGYRLHFVSDLPADSAEHTLSINLARSGANVRADTVIRALPGEIAVQFPEFSNGQQVGGLIRLFPQIAAPAAVARVEYTIDGRPLAVIEDAPYLLEWNSKEVVPGSHVIGARVVDRAGNSAEHYLTVNVVDPLILSAGTTQERLYIGDQITVEANVQALNGVASVDFLLNGISLGRMTSPPYRITFDSSEYGAGAHVFTVEVIDNSGYSERSEFAMNLQVAPPRLLLPAETWLRILAVATIVLSIFLAWLILTYLATLGRRRRQLRFHVGLANEGNMISAYLLRADDPLGLLDFQFLMDGLVLRGRQVVDWVAAGRQQLPAPVRQPAPQLPAPQPAAQPASPRNMQAQLNAQQGAMRSFSQKTSQLGKVLGVFNGLFAALAAFIPESMGGGAVRQLSRGTREVYANTKRVENINQHASAATRLSQGQGRSAFQTPEHYRNQNRTQAAPPPQNAVAIPTQELAQGGANLQQAVANALPNGDGHALALPAPVSWASQTNGKHDGSQSSGATGEGGYLSPTSTDPNLRYGSDGVIYKRVVRRVADSNWTETPEVEAGDTLQLELVIIPKKAQRTRTYNFRVSSKAVAEPGTPLQVEEASIKIRGVSWLYWLILPLLTILATAAIVLFMIYFLLLDFGLITGIQLAWPLF
ncbi:MAG: VWA domain-containing protein [Caldilineaceae bacterium]|nr:VWA domain-containing protein [Caldilineaceae bacterium]